MKNYFKNMKTITKVDYATYLGVIAAFVIVTLLQSAGMLTRSMTGMLVPICCYICMAVSLNLTVGILGELSLGHAGFMSVGAFSGVIVSMSLQSSVPNELVRLVLALVVGAILADVPLKTVFDPKSFYLVAVRQLLLPGLCLAGLTLLRVDPLTTGVAVALTGMPIGSTTAILAQKYGADAQFASKCVFISTLTSLVTVPILTLFL